MRKIIDGLLYDTETAEFLCDVSPAGFNSGDFHWEDTGLYRSPREMFFLAGEGHAMSRWAVRLGQSERGPGRGIEVIPLHEAQRLVADHCTVERYIEIFGEPEVG